MSSKNLERLMKRVNKTESCWFWMGAKNKAGYGNFWMDGKHYNAHRASYLLINGGIQAGLIVMHTCDNPSCVNPDHLIAGTYKNNTQDMISKGRAIGPTKGSEFTPCAKLTKNDVLEIRALLSKNVKPGHIASKFSVSISSISMIKNRITWRGI